MRRGEAEQLRQQMEETRVRLADNLQRISQSAQQLVDWRRYWRRYPWAIGGAVAAVGYFLVPRRPSKVVLHDRAIKRLAKQQRLVVDKGKPDSQGHSGMLALLASAVVSSAFRQMISQLARQGAQMFSHAPSRPAAKRHEAPTSR